MSDFTATQSGAADDNGARGGTGDTTVARAKVGLHVGEVTLCIRHPSGFARSEVGFEDQV